MVLGNNPFIKTDGCNKMECPRRECGHVQCYVCSKSCDYTHFAHGHRKPGCPLYDNEHVRHAREVKKAEEAARLEVLQRDKGLDPADLDIKVSDKVVGHEIQESQRRAMLLNGTHGIRYAPVPGAYMMPHRRVGNERPRNVVVAAQDNQGRGRVPGGAELRPENRRRHLRGRGDVNQRRELQQIEPAGDDNPPANDRAEGGPAGEAPQEHRAENRRILRSMTRARR